jgi:hypothetical protein
MDPSFILSDRVGFVQQAEFVWLIIASQSSSSLIILTVKPIKQSQTCSTIDTDCRRQSTITTSLCEHDRRLSLETPFVSQQIEK